MSDWLELTDEVCAAIGGSSCDDMISRQPWLSEKEIVLQGLTLIACKYCLDLNWVCEIHPTEPWSGVVGDILGCEPKCIGPGMLCVDAHPPGDT